MFKNQHSILFLSRSRISRISRIFFVASNDSYITKTASLLYYCIWCTTLILTKSNFFILTTHKMILLPYRFCGDSHHAFAFPFVLIFLPLRLSCKESSTSNQAFLNSLYDPFGSPCRGQKPQEEGCNRPTRCSEPLRYKVGGPSKVFAMLCGLGPLGCYGNQLAIILLKVSAWRGLAG